MKRIRQYFFSFLFLLGIFFIVRLLLIVILKNWLNTYVTFDNLKTSDILTIISGIISSIFAFFTNYHFKHWEVQNNIRQEAPYINITTARDQSVTGKRTMKGRTTFEIGLGKKNSEFRYVYAKIINTGKSTVVNCSIANTSVPYQLKPQTEYPICFLVYEPLKPNSRHNYSIIYQIEDGKGNKYKGAYILKIDTSKMKATFHIKRKQKEV